MTENSSSRARPSPLSPSIRSYDPQDVDAVSAVICRCLKEVNAKEYASETISIMCERFSPAKLPSWYSGMDAIVVAVDGGKIVGTGALKENRIMTVFVAPDQHGRKVGTALMNHLEEAIQKAGHTEVILSSSLSSLEFYLRRNYQEVSRFSEQIGGTMIAMKKSIGAA